MVRKIGIVTGGGDCPGLNAVIRAVVKSAERRGLAIVGILGGFEGLLEPQSTTELDGDRLGNLLTRGGTILGTSNRGRFSAKTGHGTSRGLDVAVLDDAKRGFEKLGLDALIVVGGDGSLSIALQLQRHGLPVIGIPKTIDNDLAATVMTFGFDSAVNCATDALDRLHSTSESHRRVMVLELMGRYAGWIAIYAGISGGADVILIPEIPYSYESICRKIAEREARGRHFSIVVVAEGAREIDGEIATKGAQHADREARLGGAGERVAAELEKRTKKETRLVVLGHLQRGGSPTALDRALCTGFGATAVDLLAAGQSGRMVAFNGSQITDVPLEDAVGQLKRVGLDGSFVRTARSLGICLGD